MTNVAIIYYSTYGHISTLVDSVKAGVESVPGVTATVYQVAETLSEEILAKMHAAPKQDHLRSFAAATVLSVGESTHHVFQASRRVETASKNASELRTPREFLLVIAATAYGGAK
ncbi:hypothetical protein PHYPSEUDO_015356 [Phytophthora pseudosyringae]|uniref:Flavodoxin-like domain-containing protein n=1 Tax=Phytophthora pseudosyringae TaxID=221518 RepID=A0A8T1W0E3_9STRA|nr:hypothetical protein PHYPSEUDO_015356 [Phytophthora pseudosyringae]